MPTSGEKYPLDMDPSPFFGLDVSSELEKKKIMHQKTQKNLTPTWPKSGKKYPLDMNPSPFFGLDVWSEFENKIMHREAEKNLSWAWVQLRATVVVFIFFSFLLLHRF